ncbi:MAG: IPT/TIG domain-containing protein [bacterium]
MTDPEHLRRLNQAETIVRNVVGNRNCRNYFRDNCTNGAGANALQQAFNNARIYHMPTDDNVFGAQSGTSPNIAFNLRAFRIGPNMMASTLLHEMFHTCDPNFDALDELDAENAVETCRLHTPWIDTVSPRSGAVGSRVTIRGWGFGPTRGPSDEVRIGGVTAPIVSWVFMTDNSSRVEIVAEVPAGASAGGVVVINNRVTSNTSRFAVV